MREVFGGRCRIALSMTMRLSKITKCQTTDIVNENVYRSERAYRNLMWELLEAHGH